MKHPNRISQLLETLGINQTELAERVGVSKQNVSHWVSGKQKPSAVAKRVLLEVLSEPYEKPLREDQVWPVIKQ